ncbi:CHRDL2 isoform 3, partial [Pan troglodytes]
GDRSRISKENRQKKTGFTVEVTGRQGRGMTGNLPLDSDQESQEARLPERGTALPTARWPPRRSLERLPSPDPGAEGHGQSRQSDQDIITKT